MICAMEDDEPNIVVSRLSQRIESDGTYVDVDIYREVGADGWILEVVDEEDALTLYEDRFATDQAALDEVLSTIKREGIRAFMSDHSGTVH